MRLRADQLSWREIDGETVLLDLATSKYLRVNQTGTLLLRELATGCPRDRLVTALREAYGLSEEAAMSDVDAFVAMLSERGLLEAETDER
jgi:hypothetical protein